ncbi:MAG: Ig-like domain-containing protein [Candidatus Moraniibacteriota bacterium]
MLKKINLFAVLAITLVVGGVVVWGGYGVKFFSGAVFAEDRALGDGVPAADSVKKIDTPKMTDTRSETTVSLKQEETQKEAKKAEEKRSSAETSVKNVSGSAVSSSQDTNKPRVQEKKVEVTTKTADATKVEYYIQPKQESVVASSVAKKQLPQSALRVETQETKAAEVKTTAAETVATKNYLGTAANDNPGEWNLTIDTEKRLPNGEYQIVPKLYQKDGTIVNGKGTALTVNDPRETLSPEEKVKFEYSEADTDGDGVPNKEEIRFGTNPTLADSDGDGFLDGDEIKKGFNPLKFSSGDKSDKVVFESPKTVAATTDNAAASPATEKRTVDDSRFTVNAVAMADIPATGGTQKKAARFSGKALPNIFVTLYIFSDPIIVTVKTDAEGNWTYDLDKELPDGDHEVYVAVTDNVGKITSQSRALPFVKTADAIVMQPLTAATAGEIQKNTSPLERSRTEIMVSAAIIIASFIGVALVLIGRRSSFIR